MKITNKDIHHRGLLRIWLLTISLIILSSFVRGGEDPVLSIVRNIKMAQRGSQDSSLVYANLAYQSSLLIENDTLIAKSLSALANAYYSAGNSVLALDYFFKSLQSIEDSKVFPERGRIESLQVHLYSGIGACYFDLKMKELALKYFEKSLTLINETNRSIPGTFSNHVEMIILYNTGSLYLQMNQFNKSEEFFKKVEKLNRIVKDSSTMAGLLSNNGLILKERGELDKILPLFMQSKAIWEALGSSKGAVTVYNNIGEYYMIIGNEDEAIFWFKKAISIGTECGAMRSVQLATDFLTKVYVKSGNYKDAFLMQQLNGKLADSIFNSENVTNLSKFAIQYEFDKQIKQQERIQQEALKEQKQKKLFYLLLAALFFLLLIILGLFLLNQRSKTQNAQLRRDQLDLESRNLRLEKEKLQLELESKSKELATNVMYLVQKNEYITDLAQKLSSNRKQWPETEVQILDQLIRDLHSNTNDKVWKEFELRFQDVHQDFYNRLNARFPDLSPNEKKLAAFLRLNMTSKDISAITFQSPESIKIARSRLRKKLGLIQEDNLISFLDSI